MTTTYKGWYLLDHHKNRTRPEGGMAGDPHTKPWSRGTRSSTGRCPNRGGGGDLILDNTDINEDQKVNITEMPVSLPMSTE